jgi:hypothetical protein
LKSRKFDAHAATAPAVIKINQSRSEARASCDASACKREFANNPEWSERGDTDGIVRREIYAGRNLPHQVGAAIIIYVSGFF